MTRQVDAANLLGEEQQAVEVAMAALNIALRTGGVQVLHLHLHLYLLLHLHLHLYLHLYLHLPQDTLSSLLHPALRLAGVLPAAAELYHTELQYIHQVGASTNRRQF